MSAVCAHEFIGCSVNGRCLNQTMTGVQRFTSELIQAWPGTKRLHVISTSLSGIPGHLFEQLALPLKAKGVLISPANTGPLLYTNQILVLHDVATIDASYAFSKGFANAYRFMLPLVAKNAAAIATVSEFSKRRIIAKLGVGLEKVYVVGNGVSVSEPVVSWEARLNRIVFLGSIEPRKNLPRLLEAWRRVPQTDWELVVVGARGRIFSNTIVGDEKDPRVRFTGHLSDVELSNLIVTSKALVYPSLYEGFGLPPIEAMARGCPAIVSVCGALPEVCGAPYQTSSSPAMEWVQEFGSPLAGIEFGYSPGRSSKLGSAIYCNPYSVGSIEAALRSLIEMPQADFNRLVENGRLRASKYRWMDVATKLGSLVESIGAHTIL